MNDRKKKFDLRETQKYSLLLDLIIFPVPTCFSLLKVKKNSIIQYIVHLGLALSLLGILFAAAFFQIIFPDIGSLWMLIPALIGFPLFFYHRGLIKNLPSLKLSDISKDHIKSFLILIIFFMILNILPELDLIKLNNGSELQTSFWFHKISLWQNILISVLGSILLLAGYVEKSPTHFSINRVVILYACYIVFVSEISIIIGFAYTWLSINNAGFGSLLLCTLLAALLTGDYCKTRSFGESVGKFFLKTCSKGAIFIFIWLCFMGLPRRAASEYASYYYETVEPLPWAFLEPAVIYTDVERFASGHTAADRINSFFSKAFLSGSTEEAIKISTIIADRDRTICLNGQSLCRINERPDAHTFNPDILPPPDIPFFRPIHPAWDVFLTALVNQGSVSDIDKTVAEFKSRLPKSLSGILPSLQTVYDSRIVAYATNRGVDYIPPSVKNIETLLHNNFTPVILLHLTGKPVWGAVLAVDHPNNIVVIRTEVAQPTASSIRIHFDSGNASAYREEILSRQLTIFPVEYFESSLQGNGNPIIVFPDDKQQRVLQALYTEPVLRETKQAVVYSHHTRKIDAEKEDHTISTWSDKYAFSLTSITKIKRLLEPRGPDFALFPHPGTFRSTMKWHDRLQRARDILRTIDTVAEKDRIDLAYLLANNDNVHAEPDLFIRLAAQPTDDPNLIDCNVSFIIGKQLYLLGLHKEAFPYLELASKRHPFTPEYEIWYHLVLLKLNRPVPSAYSRISSHSGLWLYYQTLSDLKEGSREDALTRLEKKVTEDSHNSMAHHLLDRYFDKPLDEKYFFPTLKGI